MVKGNFDPTLIKATLSGSFHRDPKGLSHDYRELVRNQCQVLSPRSLDFVDSTALFVRHEIEADESSFTIQRHHLQAVALSDFLWVHAPDGYVGLSGAMEIGYAYAHGVTIFSDQPLKDETLKHFVTSVSSVFEAIELLSA